MTIDSVSNAETKPSSRDAQVLLIGNPNAGKTALFNALTGLRSKTANYPGITVDFRKGSMRIDDRKIELIDLPGLYSLDAVTPEEQVAADALERGLPGDEHPDAIVLVLDATNLERNLFLASQVLEAGRPTVVALSLMDAADNAGISIDTQRLTEQLRCPVVPVSSRRGRGLSELGDALDKVLFSSLPILDTEYESCTAGCTGCPFVARFEWAEKVAEETVDSPETHGQTTIAIDRILARPIVGIVAFIAVMLGVFYLIFSIAEFPMELIEGGFDLVGTTVDGWLPAGAQIGMAWRGTAFVVSAMVIGVALKFAGIKSRRLMAAMSCIGALLISVLPLGDFRSLLVDGIIGGVGGVVVFLPQICILFFFISLLEDSGYLARAAFVMERVMRSVGLPGKAFVPMLSAHACAIPGIMAARVIENWRDRLVTILVLPLLTCSARLPVYTMVAALLFSNEPSKAALVFLGAYLTGIVAALLTAFCLKRSILRGETVPLILELPPYRMPSLRNAVMTTLDRAVVFVRKAGTVILLISVVLWAASTYPKLAEDDLPQRVAAEVKTLRNAAEQVDGDPAQQLISQADGLVAQEQLAHSFAGRLGRAFEPVFRPLGFDWKMNVGVLSSFAAREVIVSTLAIIYGIGEDEAEDTTTLTDTLRSQQHADGRPVFTTATCFSLLVFYVLAMQCLPTQAVTRRETGSWKWALLQLGYMTLLAWLAAFVTFQSMSQLGWN